MSHPRLEIVDSLPGIVECGAAVYGHEFPGFQIDPAFARRTGALPILDALEQASLEALGYELPFDSLTVTGKNAGIVAPHVDGGFRGLAVHDNEEGCGILELAFYKGGDYSPDFSKGNTNWGCSRYNGEGIQNACPAHLRGPVYEGILKPGMHTVFSEGYVGDSQPAIHFFRRNLDGPSAWTRYGISEADETRSSEELQIAISKVRLQTLQRERMARLNGRGIVLPL